MSNKDTGINGLDEVWDDSVLIKLYNSSIEMTKEELARRLATRTNSSRQNDAERNRVVDPSETLDFDELPKTVFKVDDYVRATYIDGIDYEAKIMEINSEEDTCRIKYVGYDNEQDVPLGNLLASWGKKVRREQFSKARNTEPENIEKPRKHNTDVPKRRHFHSESTMSTPPLPPPPMPPMPELGCNSEDAEYLSAMLMAWYMSGYHTGVYNGMQMARAKGKSKK